jgi:diguanylate cyclase (GGDEF)-like protein/PAS domain S-box-containing protein
MAEKPRITPEILVVDDDRFMRRFIREALGNVGYDVAEAANGEDAIVVCQTRMPDAMFLDVYLSGMDGFEACRSIRRMEGGEDVPILMVAVGGEEDLVQKAYEAGATDFLSKPVNGTLLGYRVRYLLRSARTSTALRRSRERLRLAQRIAGLGYYEWKIPENVWNFSEESRKILGIEATSAEGATAVFRSAHPEDRNAMENALAQVLAGTLVLNMEHRVVLPNGEVRHVHHKAELIRDSKNQPSRMVGIVHDLTERLQTEAKQRENEARLNYLAYHDPLTGLPNRLLFQDRCQHAIAKARRSGKKLAVLFLDLDQFKRINDSLGHDVGDQLLRQVAERLQRCAREEDTLARLGGDEFVLLLEDVTQDNAVRTVANKILAALSQTFEIGGFQLYSASSIGIAIYPDNGSCVEDLMRCADIAMYGSKESGRNAYQFYTQDMNAREQEFLLLENGLRQALANNELELYYQPQVDMDSGKIVGTEALLRWNHPERGLLLPADFLALAEETGLTFTISDWVLQTVCRQNKAWQDRGFPHIVTAVNITPRMFQQRELPQLVGRALNQSRLEPRFLGLEVTESMILQNVEASIRTLEELGRLGVSLSIDNFGTGYSSLGGLKQLPIKNLKIDRTFVNKLTSNPGDAAIAIAVIALARSMNLGVIAAGVENEEQARMLQAEGCRQGQGFHFSFPLPAEQLTRLLDRSCP